MKSPQNGTFLQKFIQVVFLFVTLLQLTGANGNCTLKIPEECRCFFDQSKDISVQCIYENSSVIGQLLQETVTDTLDLYEVTISTSEPETLPIHFFDGINSVHSIKITNSSLTKIPEAIFHLENVSFLDFSNNNIEQFDASSFHHLPNLKSVNLRHNKIKDITDTEILPYGRNVIASVDLSHNALTEVAEELRLWSIVRNLDLSSNKLSRAPDISSSSLEELVLSDNIIREMKNSALSSVPNLKTLKISNNNISSLQVNGFQGLENLQHLDISGNSLEYILDDTFGNLHHLKTLDISHNRDLSDIRNLNYPPHLASLDLSYCAIAHINKCRFLGLNDLSVFKLNNNRLPCDCETHSLYTWLREQQVSNQISMHGDDVDWLCVDGTGAHVPMNSSVILGICDPSNQKQCYTGLSNDLKNEQVELDTYVDSSSEIIKATWRIHNISTYGFYIHVKATANGETTHSPLIHRDTREYELHIDSVTGDEFLLCLEVLLNNSAIFHEVCQRNKIPSNFLHMITGIVAGVVFLVPCLAVLIWVIHKDIVYTRNQAEYDQLQEKKSAETKEMESTKTTSILEEKYDQLQEKKSAETKELESNRTTSILEVKYSCINEGFVPDHQTAGKSNDKMNNLPSEITRL